MIWINTSLAAKGGTHSPPAKSNMAARGPQNGRRVWKGVYPEGFERSKQLLPYKVFDRSTPSMRKVHN